MISSKKELKEYLKKDLCDYPDTKNFKSFFRKDFYYLIKKFLISLRKSEYYYNTRKIVRYLFASRKKNKLGYLLNIEIPINVFGPGLMIYHSGIVINSECKIGNNCRLHGNNCVGNKGSNGGDVPVIGNNCDFGYGSVAIGDITIGNNCVIGANAVVVDSFEDNSTIVGVPGKVIKK